MKNKSGKRDDDYLHSEMTPWDHKLWFQFLSKLPYPIKRNIEIDDCMADFYSMAMNVAIQTYDSENHTEEQAAKEKECDDSLRSGCITVVRFSSDEIMNNFDYVRDEILKAFQGGSTGYKYSY